MMSPKIILDKVYVSQEITVPDVSEYDKKAKKRPSWLKLTAVPKNVHFVKILINGEAFWYRRYFEGYFFPLNKTHEDYENYYDHIAPEYDRMVPQNKKIARFILEKLKYFKVSETARILELGAGTGLVAEEVVKAGYKNVFLVDISQRCLDEAKKKATLHNCKFMKEDLLSYRAKDPFDVIYNSMSLDYFDVQELGTILRLTQENMKEGGIFISVDRHVYPVYEKYFKKLDEKFFNLETPTGKVRYAFFVGTKK